MAEHSSASLLTMPRRPCLRCTLNFCSSVCLQELVDSFTTLCAAAGQESVDVKDLVKDPAILQVRPEPTGNNKWYQALLVHVGFVHGI